MPRKTTRASFIKDPLKFDGRTDGFAAFPRQSPKKGLQRKVASKSVWMPSLLEEYLYIIFGAPWSLF
ncbi:hypothetical protein D2U88_13325 [Flagellimonas aequoris]|uniref:Uncharacterized protein n=1 Tax=Flagellimonas aequoris TaxID=2306997 RepID=A0A418N5V0_9FLAO|nr:hypothetical protein D2U88_13325 [Allomuricauda aequoris]